LALTSNVYPTSCAKLIGEVPTEEQVFVDQPDEQDDQLDVVSEQEHDREALILDVNESQAVAADRMLARSNALLPTFSVCDCVALAVDKVDRGPLDPPTILAVVLAASADGDMYEIGCEVGRLQNRVGKNSLSAVGGTLTTDSVPDVTINSIRELDRLVSHFGGQGYLKCSCTAACKTKKCKCKRSDQVCNSRCHPGRACTNHD
jgi:hypothetical protein